jgi:RHS repeat-associated protein
VAVREGSSTLYYILTDHGYPADSLAPPPSRSTAPARPRSASCATTPTAQARHSAPARYTSGTTPTSRRFTGQIEDATIGLYFYNARFYDAVLGRFVQADSIVPSPGNPQSLNRYSYCLGNPVRYIDPTGFFSKEEIMGFFGVETWEEVLAVFEEGGRLEGRWGWLEVLRQSEVGTEILITNDRPVPYYHEVNPEEELHGMFTLINDM